MKTETQRIKDAFFGLAEDCDAELINEEQRQERISALYLYHTTHAGKHKKMTLKSLNKSF